MKKNLLFIAFLSVAILTIATGCDKDDSYTPNANIVNALKEKYPQAGNVAWGVKQNYHVAGFWQNGVVVEAWFDNSGKWMMTETDIKFTDLPEAVKSSFDTSEYKSWIVDDVDKVEKVGMEPMYIIEVEKGEQEVDLYYAGNGTLIKAVVDTDEDSSYVPESIPEDISNAISTKYPNAQILDIEREKGTIEVDIIDNSRHKEVVFDNSYKWVSTSWEVRKNEVPTVVMDAIKNSGYDEQKIDDIDFYETPTRNYYYFELESEPDDIHVMVTPEGEIIK